MKNKKNISSSFFLLSFLVVLAFAFNSCNSVSNENNNDTQTQIEVFSAPKIIPTKDFKVHNLKDAPTPRPIVLPQIPSDKNSQAGFYSSMQNFNTEQGLAMSSILCGFKDKWGNLWFGTSGNGVSKYDGKTFTNFTSSHGLIHNLINCITQDSKGNIWFGTYGGISIYDGIKFTNYTMDDGLVDNDVLKILEDKKGTIWVGSQKGLNRFNANQNGKDSKLFESFNTGKEAFEGSINDMIADSLGNLWIVGNTGIHKFNQPSDENKSNSFINFSDKLGLQGKIVNSVIEDTDGELWFGAQGMLCHFNPSEEINPEKAFKHYTSIDGLVDNNVFCSAIDRKGNLWFGTSEGISEFNKKDNSFLNYTTVQGLSYNNVRSITEDSAGSIWFGTLGGGISKYSGKSVIEYTEKQGFTDKAIYAISEDKKGNLWLSGDKTGIIKYQPNNTEGGTIIKYNTEGLPLNAIYCSLEDPDGSIWFGTNSGLCKFNGKTFINYTTEHGLPDNNINTLYFDKKGRLWIGTYDGGVSVFDGTSFSNFSTAEGLVHKTVWSFTEDNKNNIWIATRGGLTRFNGKSFMNFTKVQGLPDNKLSSVIQDKNGNIIVGTWGGGISIIKKKRAEEFALAYSNKKNEPIFDNFSTTQGLTNDVVYHIIENQTGSIIIGTNVGFTVLKGGISNENGIIAKDGIENYNEKTGYHIKDVSNNSAMILDKNGMVWAGTGDRLIRFDYASLNKNKQKTQLFIKDIKINNQPISWRSLEWKRKNIDKKANANNNIPSYITDELLVFERKLSKNELDTMTKTFKNVRFDGIEPFYPIPKKLVLPYSKNNISFDFVGVETSRPNLMRYQYMLRGYGSEWSPITPNTTATFGNIKEGSYSFLLKSRNPDGIWSEPIVYQFSILPPWYRTWYALFFYILLFFSGVYLMHRFQRSRLLNKERQKAMKRELEHGKEIEIAFTELKATQIQLIQSEKMASFGELTAGIAHEIQNPLNFVNNFSEVSNELLDEMNEEIEKGDFVEAKIISEEIKQNLVKIKNHGERADAIVKGMLAHSRNNSGKKEPTDLSKLTDEYVNLGYHSFKAKNKNFAVKLEIDFDDSIGKINIIPQDIGRVILNLITNAFFAVNDRRMIEILKREMNTSELNYEPTVWVFTERNEQKSETEEGITISVKDNGNGIPKEVLDKIFQPFFTTKPTGQGTGLGLSLSYDIIKAHGGEINVDTELGIGTTFCILLPGIQSDKIL